VECDVDDALIDYLCRLFCFELDMAREEFDEHQTAYRQLPEPERTAIRAAIGKVARVAVTEYTDGACATDGTC
jgi:hypothetical protein